MGGKLKTNFGDWNKRIRIEFKAFGVALRMKVFDLEIVVSLIGQREKKIKWERLAEENWKSLQKVELMKRQH